MIYEREELRDRSGVFRDRSHAGKILAQMLQPYQNSNALVLAIPAGGIPIAKEIAKLCGLPLDFAVVSKVTLPWNTEAGYGALAFDGSVVLNHDMIERLGLTEQAVIEGIEKTRRRVRGRLSRLREGRPFPPLASRPIILVDDGLASGFTLKTAVEALKRAGATQIIVAIPTGHEGAILKLSEQVDAIYCPNIRGGFSFAVADAYEHWSDISEEEALSLLTKNPNP
jgi:putative phosphoribosyl transferase